MTTITDYADMDRGLLILPVTDLIESISGRVEDYPCMTDVYMSVSIMEVVRLVTAIGSYSSTYELILVYLHNKNRWCMDISGRDVEEALRYLVESVTMLYPRYFNKIVTRDTDNLDVSMFYTYVRMVDVETICLRYTDVIPAVSIEDLLLIDPLTR